MDNLDRPLSLVDSQSYSPGAPDNVVARFEQIAVERPDHPALICGDEVINYAHLNAQANILAHELIGQIGRGRAIVAILTGFGTQRWIAALGVLKAGHAVVILDPVYPEHHTLHILNECRAGVIVADQSTFERATRFAQIADCALILIDQARDLSPKPNPCR